MTEQLLGLPKAPEWPRWYAHVHERSSGGWVWQLLCKVYDHGRKVLVADGEADTEEAALDAARREKEARVERQRRRDADYEVQL